jgi:hypothetical protein
LERSRRQLAPERLEERPNDGLRRLGPAAGRTGLASINSSDVQAGASISYVDREEPPAALIQTCRGAAGDGSRPVGAAHGRAASRPERRWKLKPGSGEDCVDAIPVLPLEVVAAHFVL